MLVLLACARAGQLSQARYLKRPLLANFHNARNDPLTVLMRRFVGSFAFFERLHDNDAGLTDAIYTTRPQMSSQNIGQVMKFELVFVKISSLIV
jgi:hypothetical protein